MKRVNVNSYFFVVLGGMEGILLSLVASFFLDYMLTRYSLIYSLTFLDWLFVLAPLFAVIGALFNLASAIFLYDEDTKKPKKRFMFDKGKNKKNKKRKTK